jgi:single-strand DNA-binding protein
VNRRRGRDNEETSYIDCEAWDRQAEFVQQWFTKGKPIFIEGRLKQDRWEDKATGQGRSKLILVCERASFVGGREDGQGEGGGDYEAGGGGGSAGGGGGNPPRGAGGGGGGGQRSSGGGGGYQGGGGRPSNGGASRPPQQGNDFPADSPADDDLPF